MGSTSLSPSPATRGTSSPQSPATRGTSGRSCARLPPWLRTHAPGFFVLFAPLLTARGRLGASTGSRRLPLRIMAVPRRVPTIRAWETRKRDSHALLFGTQRSTSKGIISAVMARWVPRLRPRSRHDRRCCRQRRAKIILCPTAVGTFFVLFAPLLPARGRLNCSLLPHSLTRSAFYLVIIKIILMRPEPCWLRAHQYNLAFNYDK